MSSHQPIALTLLSLLGLAAGCDSFQNAAGQPRTERRHALVADDEDDDEVAVALDRVPAAIRQAAEAAVPGFVLASAVTETESGTPIYSLEGEANGEDVEVEVRTSDARVLKIERGEEDDDDHGDDGDDDDGDGDDDEVDVPVDQVPAAIRQAAEAAVSGFVLQSAEKETEDGATVYCLEGEAGGEHVEVEVRARDAKVLEIERGEDDDDDDED